MHYIAHLFVFMENIIYFRIKSVESEKGNPSLKTLEKIADVLGLELVMKVKIMNE